jgi:tripartite-type tricarboxylate transporter receptor subunit TctC
MLMWGRILLAAAAAVALAPSLARAQTGDWPRSPIRMIVPFAPGGASDFAARLLQPRLSDLLGQKIIVDNRPGAAGNVGYEAAARSAPDGYTLFLGNVGTVSVNPTLFPSLKLRPDKDLVAVSIVADTPSLLVATLKFPPNDAKELVEYAKQNKGKVNYASPGSGSLNRLEMELFRANAGLDMNHVPYKGGAGPAVNDLLGGHVDTMFVTISSAIAQVQGSQLKGLGVTTRTRIPGLPNVPTLVEQGFPESVSSSWQGILVPTGTPEPIIAKLHAAIVETMKDETIRTRMQEAGVIAISSPTPQDFSTYIAEDTAKWAKVIERTGIQPD